MCYPVNNSQLNFINSGTLEHVIESKGFPLGQIGKFVLKLSHGDTDRTLMPNKSNVVPTMNHVGMQYPVMSALDLTLLDF